MRPSTKLLAALAGGGLLLATAACGEAPSEDTGSDAPTFKACMVTDTGGVDDKSFNTSAWAGMQAASEQNKAVEVDYVQSNSEADYESNLQTYVDGDCGLIVAVGGLMAEATTKIAEANPEQAFAIVDSKIDLPNVYSMEFNAAQSSFMAGYLAAGSTKTKKVATYGGLNIPPVTIFMDGFVEGVAYYNEQKGTDVKVLGWDAEKASGTFADSFTDTTKGKTITDNFVSQGADIIFPVAGGTGAGTTNVALENTEISVIWVDVDGCVSQEAACSTFLSTSEKNIKDAVTKAVLDTQGGTMGGHYVGTLENNGVSLAPFHEKDASVPAELKTELETIKTGIIDGSIPIASKSQPAAS